MYEESDAHRTSPSESTVSVTQQAKPTPPVEPREERRPGTHQLSFKAFLVVMAFLVVTPPSIIFFLYAVSPPKPAPDLHAEIQLHQFLVEQEDGSNVAAQPGYVEVTNPTDEKWDMVSLTVNDRFYFHAAKQLAPGDSLQVFLSSMQTKNGFHRFDETYGPVEEITVYARLPSGSRAMYEKALP